MSKRFTETEKWNDTWFRKLPPEFKLAWDYLTTCCDAEGVIDLDRELADFRIGATVDWDEFLDQCGDRVLVLEGYGKVFVTQFIPFQYGELSDACKAHNPVFASLKKHNLERYSKGYSKGIQRVQEKEKDKDKDLNKEKEEWVIPKQLDSDEVRALLADFEAMRSRIRKPIRSRANASKVLRHFDDQAHLVFALETCIANEYQGLKADYRPPTTATTKDDPRGNLGLLESTNGGRDGI